ncbi:MAG: putative Ig domain-containing protein [Pseudomonadota bacterium]
MKTLTLFSDTTLLSFRTTKRNPVLKFLLRLFAIFGVMMVFAVSGWGNDVCGSPRDSDTLSSSNLQYERYRNDNDWNVGANTSGTNDITSRNFYFSVASAGTVTIELYSIDNDQARFSYGDSTCPTASSGVKTKTVTFTGAEDFNIKVYYVAGAHGSIEYGVRVTFTPVVVATAVNDTITVVQNSTVSGNVLTNDTGPSISVTTWNNPSHGTLSAKNNATGAFTYTPTSGYSGLDSFTYEITDSGGHTSTATVNITVTAPLITDCPGTVITNLNGATATATDSASGTIISDTTYYYYFTPAVAGTLDVNSNMTGSDRNDLYVLDGCGGSTLDSRTNNSNNKSLTGISVSSNQTIVIQYVSNSGSDRAYSLDFTFTVVAPTPPTIAVPDQPATVSTAFSVDLDSYVTPTNGDPITAITLTGTLPAGLTYDTTTHIISGTPTATGTTAMSVTATDKDGTSNVDEFSIVVSVLSPPTGSVPDQYLNVSTAMTALDLDNYFTSNNGAITFPASIASLPAGLSYSSSTHAITGTPTTVTATTSYTIAVSNSQGSMSDTFTITVYPSYSNSNIRDFTLQRQDNIYGDMQIIGNSIMLDSSKNSGAGGCADNGTPNNNVNAMFADRDSDSGTFNSTSANLKLPKGVDSTRIQYAYLYWQGRTNGSSYTVNGKTMKLKTYGDTAYTTIDTNTSKFNWNGDGDYQGSADVTNQIKHSIDQVPLATISASGYDHPVWGADVYARLSSGDNDFGAWSLVVVYKDPDPVAKFRSVTLFDGYLEVFNSNKTVTLNGFLTPKTGLVDAKFLMFGGEGDISYSDGLTLTNSSGTAISLLNAPGTPSGTTSVWGSSEDINGVNVTNRNPNCQNTIGIDMRTFSVGTSSATPIIGNNQTSTAVSLKGTGDDQYFPGVFAFSTELYMPKLCYDYSLKQDGSFLSIDRSNPIAQINQAITSSPLELSVYLRNKEADITAQHISLKADLNASRFDYTMSNPMYVSNPNGSALIDRGVPADNSPASCIYDTASGNEIGNQGCVAFLDNNLLTTDDDQRRVRKGIGSLGSEQYIYNKFILKPKAISGAIGDVNESLGLTIDYQITAGGVTMPYTDYVLGSSTVPICTQVSSYNPTWGLFNIVQHGLQTNNLTTQISRKPFNVDVIFDSTPNTGDNYRPDSVVNTTVQVEMIDVDSFGDINASCANPDANVSTAIYVPVSFAGGAAAPNYQTLVPTQDINYHNFALKNGAYRVWYFTDSSGVLRTWSPVGLSNANKSMTGISGALFDSASHGDCNSSCGVSGGSATSLGCFNCMKENYAKPLCSRDNFSVRPEAFDIRIKDYNTAGTVTTDLSHDVYKYAPNTTPTARMSLAAGYDYKYDINATGYENNVSGLIGVPRYTRYYKDANSDFNATMIWDSALTNATCNDISSRNLSFFLLNGSLANQINHQDQVGDYRLNMIDKSWTAVDQVNHSNANGFLAGTDCNTTSNSTSGFGLYGCQISSAHINTPLLYKDQNLTLKPAKFDLVYAYGLGKDANATNTGAGGQGFVYMSDLSNTNDMNMSVRATGQIRALGSNNSTLSNFVGGCFAKDLNITAGHDANLTYATPFVTRMINSTIANAQTFDSFEVNQTSKWIGIVDDSNFTKADSGVLINTIRFNFDRNETMPYNSQVVAYSDINVTCAISADCNQSSVRNSTPDTAVGSSAMNFNVTHVYGRVIAKDQRVMGLIAFEALARYEVYKIDNLFGTALTVDPDYSDWYINKLHTEATYGDASVTVIDPSTSSSLPNGTSTYADGIETYKFNPFTVRQGYKAHIDTEGWLWNSIAANVYKDPVYPVTAANDCDNHPCFNITFGRIIGNTGSAKTESENAKANKKSSSVGWSTTNEYAPAIR